MAGGSFPWPAINRQAVLQIRLRHSGRQRSPLPFERESASAAEHRRPVESPAGGNDHLHIILESVKSRHQVPDTAEVVLFLAKIGVKNTVEVEEDEFHCRYLPAFSR